jgi:hypothetical protein
MEMNRTQFVALAALLVAAFVWPAKGVAADSDFYPLLGATRAGRTDDDREKCTGRRWFTSLESCLGQ